MKYRLILMLWVVFAIEINAQNDESVFIKEIFDNALTNQYAYNNLEHLCKFAPGRLVGYENSLLAVEYMKQYFENLDVDSVYLQEFTTPVWKCDSSSVFILSSADKPIMLHCDALGPSPSSQSEGITAEVIEVKSLAELEKLGREVVSGKIVFFNRKWDHTFVRTFEGYGNAVDQRSRGPEKAAEYGAVAVIIRSVTNSMDHFPHTGNTHFTDKKIPAVAIGTLDADLLSEHLIKDSKAKVRVFVDAEEIPEAKTYNLIAEFKGKEKPEEIIVIGSHIDTWFNTQGAHDDGAGVVMTSDVLRIFKELEIENKRTIRVVIYMDEELYQSGGKAYAKYVKGAGEKHYLALESDGGAFTPSMFTVDGSVENVRGIARFLEYLEPYGIDKIKAGWGGVDIGPLKEMKVPLMSYGTDSQRYFDLHHSANDTFDKINLRELQLGSGCITSIIYLIDKYGIE
jgi:Zn-dependent M28 family amino/carboxypeptidase